MVTRTASQGRYPQLLCACGHARCDERGTFRTADVVEAMAGVFGEAVGTNNIKRALGSFCDESRGGVLTRDKIKNVMYYRFRDPMMRPFLRIKARSIRGSHGPVR